MNENDNLNKLEVYQEAVKLCSLIWDEGACWKYFPQKTIGIQFVRAADSIGANIAESSGRHFYSERLQFLYYARGSLMESTYWFSLAKARNLILAENMYSIEQLLNELPKKLNGFINYIRSLKQNN